MTMYFLHPDQQGKIATESPIWRGAGNRGNWQIPPEYVHKLKMWVTVDEWEHMLLDPNDYSKIYTKDGSFYMRSIDFHNNHVADRKTWVEFLPEPEAKFWRDVT